MSRKARCSHSSLVAPQQVSPCPPRTTPSRSGLSGQQLAVEAAQLPARPDPGDPGHPAAVALGGQALPVGAGRQGDHAVGVQVVDVGPVDQPVHRGVDRRRRPAGPVGAPSEQLDHLVLVRLAPVALVEPTQPVQLQHGQPPEAQRPQVAAGALHVQQGRRLAGGRVGDLHLAGGVAAAVVRHRRVGPQPVGPVQHGGDVGRDPRGHVVAAGTVGVRLLGHGRSPLRAQTSTGPSFCGFPGCLVLYLPGAVSRRPPPGRSPPARGRRCNARPGDRRSTVRPAESPVRRSPAPPRVPGRGPPPRPAR